MRGWKGGWVEGERKIVAPPLPPSLSRYFFGTEHIRDFELTGGLVLFVELLKLFFEEKLLFTECGLQIIQPDGF
jgi:hypothetical protein